jgi:hypothetical protein
MVKCLDDDDDKRIQSKLSKVIGLIGFE